LTPEVRIGRRFEPPREETAAVVDDRTPRAGARRRTTAVARLFRVNFIPHTEYWIAFGTYASSQVLDVTALGDAAQIGFPDGISAMDATRNPDGTWTIAPTHLAVEV
jgi:hypothetical protein